MSYASKKGYDGEVETAKYYTDVFKEWGYIFKNVGGAEKNKKLSNGDVIIRPGTDPNNICFLKDYFLECKKRARISIWDVMEEAEGNAKTYNKVGAIAYVIQQGSGHKRDGELVVMTKETFRRLAIELQGFRNEAIDN